MIEKSQKSTSSEVQTEFPSRKVVSRVKVLYCEINIRRQNMLL